MLQIGFRYILLMETSSITYCESRRRPPSKLQYNVDDLPKAVIRDLAHAGTQTLFAEFKPYVFNNH